MNRSLLRMYGMNPNALLPVAEDGDEGGGGTAPEGQGDGGGESNLDLDGALAALAQARKDAAKYRRQVRDLEPLAHKAKELEDAGKSEIQKAAEKATAAEQRAQAAELNALRLEVAFDKGLTPAQARRLLGATRDELEKDADDLLSSFAPAGKTPPTKRPRENLKSGNGSDPDEGLDVLDPEKLAALVPRQPF